MLILGEFTIENKASSPYLTEELSSLYIIILFKVVLPTSLAPLTIKAFRLDMLFYLCNCVVMYFLKSKYLFLLK